MWTRSLGIMQESTGGVESWAKHCNRHWASLPSDVNPECLQECDWPPNTANTPMRENVHKSCVLLNWVRALVFSEHFTNFAPRTNYVCLVCATTRGAIKNFHIKSLSAIWATSWKNLFMSYANNKGADQPALPRSLISAFVVCCLESIISLVSICAISLLSLASVALSLIWSETLEGRFSHDVAHLILALSFTMSKGNLFDPGHPDGEFGLQTELLSMQSNGSYCYVSAL